MSVRARIRVLAAAVFALVVCGAWAACPDGDALPLTAKIDGQKIIRADAPRELFGFNVPWREFQDAFFRKEIVRSDLIAFLRPFRGAVYRYPGGTPSNWFEWKNAVGPSSQRGLQHQAHNRYSKVEFGVNELAKFLETVDGRAIITANLVGPYKSLASEDQLAASARDMASILSQAEFFNCQTAQSRCGLFAIELGNEVDRAPHNFSASEYIARAEVLRAAITQIYPNVPMIANGRSAPWDRRAADFKEFNGAIVAAMGRNIAGLAIHPYYDGISVNTALRYVDNYAATAVSANPKARVFVTEHARWPAKPATGPWKANWFQTTSLGGAISTADFLLGLMSRPSVRSANWHALAATGPWQLVAWDRASDALTPSALYWGLRILREAYLDDVIAIDYKPSNTAGYHGHYDQRLIAMRSHDGARHSLLGVNRATKPIALAVEFTGSGGMENAIELRWITGESSDVHNTVQEPNKVSVQHRAEPRGSQKWCIPARSVFALVSAG